MMETSATTAVAEEQSEEAPDPYNEQALEVLADLFDANMDRALDSICEACRRSLDMRDNGMEALNAVIMLLGAAALGVLHREGRITDEECRTGSASLLL